MCWNLSFYKSFYNNLFSIFVERYLVTLLISLSYSEYIPSSVITNIPVYYLIRFHQYWDLSNWEPGTLTLIWMGFETLKFTMDTQK
jgi:hypothetical protein